MSRGTFLQKPMTVVDIGARGGREHHWKIFGNQIKIIGFEPDIKECARLNKLNQGPNTTYYPFALWEKKGERKFYIMKNLPSSSFFKPKQDFWVRFPDRKNLAIKKEVYIKTTNLDSFIKEHHVGYVDFIKLDIEGAELPTLKGGLKTIKNSVLGITCEVLFSRILYNQPVFAEIDLFLRSLGFVLFDLGLIRLGRSTLSSDIGPKKEGQVIGGHALYLRDAASEILSANKYIIRWNDIQLLKLASVMELYGLLDCAIELLQTASKRGFLKNWEILSLTNLILSTKDKGRLMDISISSIFNRLSKK